MANATASSITVNLWTAKVIPVLLAGIVAYATYVIVGPLTIDYLLAEQRRNTGAAIPILIIYFLLLIFMGASFFRLVYITFYDPPYVALGPAAIRDQAKKRERRSNNVELRDAIGRGEYNTDNGSGDSDSPGLEMFYTKDIFVAEMDGKPKWCTHCANWKPDRAHHCSSSGRCIKKMDHFCPWVGGPIGENNFKFFIQFTGYTALYCFHILVVMAYYVHQQRSNAREKLNPQFIVALALSAFFGLFTAGMTASSIELAIRNQTQVERLGAETRVHILAVLKPPPGSVPPVNDVAGPAPSYMEITYPLDTGISYRSETSDGTPQTKITSHTRQADQAVASNVNETNPSIPFDAQGMPRLLPGNSPDQQTEKSLPPSRDPSDSSTIVAAAESSQNTTDRAVVETQWPSREIAERDLRATRTFNILKMLEPGYNPWDLGSSLLNWESLMGASVLDWLLPLRRSPCCNHDDDESYYLVGPMVDLLKSKYNLLPESEIRAYGGRRRAERRDPADIEELHSHYQNKRDESHSKKRRRRHHSKLQEEDSATEVRPIDTTEPNERE